MNKLASDRIQSYYYNLGAEAAMSKTANLSTKALRELLSGGPMASGALRAAQLERVLGQAGTIGGSLLGGTLGLAAAGDDMLLATLLGGGTGAAAGGALGNLIGRRVGAPLGRVSGSISGLPPLRSVGNFLADPLARVPGIRG